jgi:sirohydrochlorin ferrochelatase
MMSPAVLVLTAHGSVDPRAAANTHANAELIRRARPGLDVRVAFCEKSTPNVRDVVAEVISLRASGSSAVISLRASGSSAVISPRASGSSAIISPRASGSSAIISPRASGSSAIDGQVVVTPLLLADAYHARVDIPAMIADSDALQADVLGEDDRLVTVLRHRVRELGVSRLDPDVGVVVVAVGSSRQAANARTEAVSPALAAGTRWAGVETAFATGPAPSLGEATERLRAMGARRLVIAPWFLAHGRITDRVREYAAAQGIAMAQPLGAHRLVAYTVLQRFDHARAEANRLAA